MSSFLHDILIDPATQESLSYDATAALWTSPSNQYKNQQDVPILLQSEKLAIANDELHERYQTDFDYQEHYQKDAEFFDYFEAAPTKTQQGELNRLHEVIIRQVPKGANRILDVGCGGAWVARHFVAKGKQVISMDISSTNPIQAKKDVPADNHLAIVGDVFALPIKTGSMDCIIAAEIMEHVPDPKRFIECLVAALDKGGKLIITTPYNEKREFCLCVHCNKPTPRSAHLHSFNEQNIPQLIPSNIQKWSWQKFSNKYLLKLRVYRVLSFIPHSFWRALDKLANRLFPTEMRLMITIEK